MSDDDTPLPVGAGQKLRPGAFAEAVATRSGMRRADARLAIEAVLGELAEAFERGEAFVLPGLGAGKITRNKNGGLVIKLRLKNDKNGELPLAPPDVSG
ncbi:HU family DNA-binding protein [Falsigemmobacter faecalis]|nr:HU family DNA-binding protein [Falsigemmobacter faecalis]